MSNLLFASFSLEDQLDSLGIDNFYFQQPYRLIDLSGVEDPPLTLSVIDYFLQGEEVRSSLEAGLTKLLPEVISSGESEENNLSISSFQISPILSTGVIDELVGDDVSYRIPLETFLVAANNPGAQPSFEVRAFFRPTGDEFFDDIYSEGYAFDLRLSLNFDLAEIYSLYNLPPDPSDVVKVADGALFPTTQAASDFLNAYGEVFDPSIADRVSDEFVENDFSDGDEVVTTNEDTTLTGNLLSNASPNPTGDGALSISSFSINGESGTFTLGSEYTISGKGDLTINPDGTYSFVPFANYNGSVPEVTYTVSDGIGASVDSTLNITVNSVDDTFTDSGETVSTDEDTTLTGNLLSNASPNPTGDGALSISSFSINGESGTFTLGSEYTISGKGDLTINSDGTYSFVPFANYNGSVPEVTYTVSDGIGASVDSTLNITVNSVDDTFTDSGETVSTDEDTTLTGNLLSNASPNPTGDGALSISSFSINGESGTFTLGSEYTISGKGDLTINSDGTYSFVPFANYNGSVPEVTYTVSDGIGASVDSTLNITVNSVDDTFTDSGETVSTDEDTTLTGNLLSLTLHPIPPVMGLSPSPPSPLMVNQEPSLSAPNTPSLAKATSPLIPTAHTPSFHSPTTTALFLKSPTPSPMGSAPASTPR